ncbi:MAG TPA: lactate utilization protein [Chloroflexia bacterium]|nr:lactate utilization protein [Chloroflexia bacterium]
MTASTEVQQARLNQFKERAQAAGAKVYPVESISEAARLILDLMQAKDQREIALAPVHLELADDQWQNLLERLRQETTIKPCETAQEVASTLFGLSYADLCVAETGSLVFANNDLRTRMVAMLTFINFALVDAAKMVDSLDDVGQHLQRWQAGDGEKRYISMVTGPSRTADIERVLTIGVQGPQELHILLLQ